MFKSKSVSVCATEEQSSSGASSVRNNKPILTLIIMTLVVAAAIALQLRLKPQSTTTGAEQAQEKLSGPVELTLWDQEESENTKVMDDWIAKFTSQNPEIRVVRQTYPNEDLRTKFTTAATAGQAAEMVWGPNDVAGVFSTADLIQSVESFVNLGAFTPRALEAVTLKSQIMGVPVTYGNHLMLFYNKNMVEKAPATTDELIQVARTFTDSKANRFGLVFFQNEPFWLMPFVGAFQGWPVRLDPDGEVRLELNSDGMKNALTYLKRLKDVERIIPKECDYDCAKGLFLEGKAAFTINGDWSVKEFKIKLGDKLGIAALPVLSETNQPMTPMVSGRYVFINREVAGQKKVAVKKFLSFLTSREVQIEVAERLRRIPSTSEALSDPQVIANSEVQLLNAAAAYGRPMPAQTEMRAAWDAMRPVQQKIMSGDLSPQDGAEIMQQSALEKLASLKK
ncbi:MAG: hypothetical protein RJB13_2425 [Pseudomonadota bacterium]|jgi:maltose-binding protein MalE